MFVHGTFKNTVLPTVGNRVPINKMLFMNQVQNYTKYNIIYTTVSPCLIRPHFCAMFTKCGKKKKSDIKIHLVRFRHKIAKNHPNCCLDSVNCDFIWWYDFFLAQLLGLNENSLYLERIILPIPNFWTDPFFDGFKMMKEMFVRMFNISLKIFDKVH